MRNKSAGSFGSDPTKMSNKVTSRQTNRYQTDVVDNMLNKSAVSFKSDPSFKLLT